MRIAFVGKGGSGKTTLSALFTRYLAELGQPVLAVDADQRADPARGQGVPAVPGARRGASGAVRVIGNKVAAEDDTAWLRGELGTALLVTVGQSAWVRAAEQGRAPAFDALEPEVRRALDAVLAELDGVQRDWTAYHRDTVHFHLRNARAWANQSVGRNLADQVDPEFLSAVCW